MYDNQMAQRLLTHSLLTTHSKCISAPVTSHQLSIKRSIFTGVLVLWCSGALFSCSSTPKPSETEKKIGSVSIYLAKDIKKEEGRAIPVDETETFTPEDPQALLWVKLKNLSDKHTLRWEWYDPTGKLYSTTGNYEINKDSGVKDYSTSWHKIAIKGEKAEKLHGKWRVKVLLDNTELIANKEFEIKEGFELYKYITRGPQTKVKPDRGKWALIIGIERYKKTVSVPYAERDARLMRDYLTNFIGVPEENTITLINDGATKAEIDVITKDRLKGLIREGDTLYLYYSGHGIPADETPYLLPYDGDAESPKITAYQVEELYKDLDQLPAKNIFVFMDTCFSGRSGREEKEEILVAGARPGILKVKDPLLLSKKIIAMAAAKSNQLSNYYREKQQGLFTYYLLMGMVGYADKDSDKKVQIKELAQYVEENVGDTSRRLFGLSRQQNPVVMPRPLGDRERLPIAEVIK